jgi:hypothetical protein
MAISRHIGSVLFDHLPPTAASLAATTSSVIERQEADTRLERHRRPRAASGSESPIDQLAGASRAIYDDASRMIAERISRNHPESL